MVGKQPRSIMIKTRRASFGVNTYSYMYRFSALDCLKHLSDSGFTDFELMLFPDHIWPSETSRTELSALRTFTNANDLQ